MTQKPNKNHEAAKTMQRLIIQAVITGGAIAIGAFVIARLMP